MLTDPTGRIYPKLERVIVKILFGSVVLCVPSLHEVRWSIIINVPNTFCGLYTLVLSALLASCD